LSNNKMIKEIRISLERGVINDESKQSEELTCSCKNC
jgi:hypothetical protein